MYSDSVFFRKDLNSGVLVNKLFGRKKKKTNYFAVSAYIHGVSTPTVPDLKLSTV